VWRFAAWRAFISDGAAASSRYFIVSTLPLDSCRLLFEAPWAELGKYRPCTALPLLVKYVEAGWLGRKSGGREISRLIAARTVPTR